MKTNDLSEKLKFLRIFDPNHIPKIYIDQIKDKEFTSEKFYEFQEEICLVNNETGVAINQNNLLFVLVDANTMVKGVLWMVIDTLSNSLVINTFSVDKEYWGNGKAVLLLKEKAIEIKNNYKLDRIYWITRCPKHSEKFGFKRSKHTLMEYKDYGQFCERSSNGDGCETGGNSQLDDERTTENTQQNLE